MNWQFLTYGTLFSGVEHTVEENAKERLYFLQLQKKKKELRTITKKAFSSVEEMQPYFKLQKHLFLVINNQHVLFKKVDTINKPPIELVKEAFPSIKLSDFYYETISTEIASFVAICRKEYVENLIKKYESIGISVIDFSLGNLIIQNILPFIDQETVYTSNSRIVTQKNTIAAIFKEKITSTTYIVNELNVGNNELLALSGIICYYTQEKHIQLGFETLQTKLQQEYFQKHFYNLGLKITLGTLFLILLINFIIFSKYHATIQQINTELQLNSSKKNTLTTLQNSIQKKSKLVKSMALVANSKTSWYLNEIGKLVPQTILLSEFYFQPVVNSIKEKQEIIVADNQIKLSGISKNNANFTKWISALENKKWIKSVQITTYGKGKEITTSFEFTITLTN